MLRVCSFKCQNQKAAHAHHPRNTNQTRLCKKMAEIMCGWQVASNLKTVPLSNNTVKDRTDQMIDNVECRRSTHFLFNFMKCPLWQTKQYSLKVKQDILLYTNLSTTTRGDDIFHGTDMYYRGVKCWSVMLS